MSHKIYFVVPELLTEFKQLLAAQEPLSSPESIAPEHPPLRSVSWSWIVQTFLYMKQAGLEVELVDRLVEGAICVLHYEAFRDIDTSADSFIVGIRADNPPIHMREIEVVQSPANMNTPNTFLMDHWPESRLIPRDPRRENRVERISYFGGEGGLSPQYTSPAVRSALEQMGIVLSLYTDQWNNYEETDIVLAVRDHHHPRLIDTKPASKLVNAWRAGCVALLGKEPAYRGVGRPSEDYFEIDSPENMLQVVKRLKASPQLYESVRAAGLSRAPEFGFEAVQEKWVELLLGPVTEAYVSWKSERKGLSRLSQRYVQSVRQEIDRLLFKIPVRTQIFIESRRAQ